MSIEIELEICGANVQKLSSGNAVLIQNYK